MSDICEEKMIVGVNVSCHRVRIWDNDKIIWGYIVPRHMQFALDMYIGKVIQFLFSFYLLSRSNAWAYHLV